MSSFVHTRPSTWFSRACQCSRVYKRGFSTSNRIRSSDSVFIKSDSSGIATIYMNNPPVNSLNSEFLVACTDAIQSVESDNGIKGAIVTSKFDGKVFCAGLNITDMFQKSHSHLVEFWTCVQNWYLAWYGCKKPTVAAINGHAPAGGCALAMMCDYRIMQTDKYDEKLIGLNETQLGIVAPFFFVDLMKKTIGHRRAEHALNLGRMYSPEAALTLGIVDKISPLESVISLATTELTKFTAIPAKAFALSKLSLRQDALQRLNAIKQQDSEHFANYISQATVQQGIGNYLQALKSRKQ